MPSENNKTKISDIMSMNSLKGDKHDGSLNLKSSAKFKAKCHIFLLWKTEVETELKELLCYEKDDNVQPETLKLRAIHLREILTSLGVANWINSNLDQIDPIGLSNWEDQISKDIARVLYGAEEKITIRKGLAQTGFAKRDPPKFNGSVLDFPLLKKMGNGS